MKQLHPVHMSADFEITLPQPLDLVTHPDNISVGGFFAIVNGRGIPFDFDITSCDVEKSMTPSTSVITSRAKTVTSKTRISRTAIRPSTCRWV